MFYTEPKIKSRIKELEPFRYISRTPIPNWKAKEDISKEAKYPPRVDETWDDFPVGTRWEGRDYYLWVITEFDVPTFEISENFVLLFNFGQIVGGYNSECEALLFINNVPYQGIDSNHPEVFLDHRYSGQKIRLAIKLWSGLEGGGPVRIMCHQFSYGDFAMLSPEVDNFYYTTLVMLDTILLLDANHPERFFLLNLLDKAFNMLDWSDLGSANFYQSISWANSFLEGEVGKMSKNSPITVTAIGHSHIDVAWLWRLKHTREKCARTFTTALQLMKRYPEYFFLQSQPQLYAYIKEDYPEIYDKIKDKIEEGIWEVDGAMWVEADCNLSSGESLVRQILHGKRFIKKEFDKDVHYLWLPDVFGYSWALPQILLKSGINTFMTTKISWNQYNRLPHDTFIWRGIDGSEVLTHFITTPDIYGGPENLSFFYTYGALLDPATVKGIYDNYRNKDFNSELLLAYGYGDGGGGVTREMLEKRRRLDRMPQLPNVRTGRAGDFFQRLHQTVENSDTYVHTWDGELYLEYHRGTYTSQGFIKKWNRKLELALRDMEILHSFAYLTKEDWKYPKEKLYHSWEIVLRNQFHDIIPGSSIKEVYEDNVMEYQKARDLIAEMQGDIAKHYLQQEPDNTWTIFNNAGWKVTELVEIPIAGIGHFHDENKQLLPGEPIEDGYLVEVSDVAPLGCKVITFVNSVALDKKDCPFIIGRDNIDSPYYSITWNEQGQLISIYDKDNDRQILKEGCFGNQLRLFEDKPMNFDAWDIDIFYTLKSKTLSANKIELINSDSLLTSIGFTYEFGQSSIYQEMVVYAHSGRIDFKTSVNWQERQQLLRTSFDVDIRSTMATYDIQYGNVKRPTHWNTSWDMARFESVAHQWVDLSQHDYGVALLNDSKYGHSVKDNTLSLSLLKGPIYPNPEGDIGEHEFTYSLLPHKGDFVKGHVSEEAWSLNSPLAVYRGSTGLNTFINISSENPVYIDAIKLREDEGGIILRLHDHIGSRRRITLEPQFEYISWVETNLMEEVIGEDTLNTDGKIHLDLTPYEIKTIWIRNINLLHLL